MLHEFIESEGSHGWQQLPAFSSSNIYALMDQYHYTLSHDVTKLVSQIIFKQF